MNVLANLLWSRIKPNDITSKGFDNEQSSGYKGYKDTILAVDKSIMPTAFVGKKNRSSEVHLHICCSELLVPPNPHH